MKKGLVLFILLNINFVVFSQSHWESIILAGDQWKYLPATNQPPSNWNSPSFDDSSWLTGIGGIGYGDSDDATMINPVNSVYLRIKFQITDKSVVKRLLLDIDYDDAFIAYLNGIEIARSNNVVANPPLYNSAVNPIHEALMYSGGKPDRFEVDLVSLNVGENTLAVQILNESTTSSDLTGLVFLNVRIDSPANLFRSTPTWFIAPPEMNESNLPIFVINTNGQTIPNEPKITASLGIIDNIGKINYITDPFTYKIDFIGIEVRGSSSQQFDKKNYGFETRLSTGESNDVSLLGLPAENDWTLHGPYTDKSLMRNALTYYLGSRTGHYAPRARYCELYINGDYRGVYVLIEKIKRNKNRVNVSKLEPNEITGEDLTGGYILSIDRPDDFYWTSPYKGMNGTSSIVINVIYPDYVTMPDQQKQYIRNYVTSFENALNSSTYKDPTTGYRAYTDINSFIDFFLTNELSRNVDGYRLSSFFYKDKGGKLTMGPLWDFDIAYGNANYYQGFEPQGWVMDGVEYSDSYQIPFWWARLRTDSYFNGEMKKRWLDLRQGAFKIDEIFHYIDSIANILNEGQKRNFTRFPILGQYVWPNYNVGKTYQEEVSSMKTFLYQRLGWIDQQMNLITDIDENISANAYETYAFPNPFIDQVTIRTTIYKPARVSVNVVNLIGQKVYSSSKNCSPGNIEFAIPSNEFGNSVGMYIYEVKINGKHLRSGKIIRQ